MYFFKKSRSEVKKSGWFTSTESTTDEEIIQARKPKTQPSPLPRWTERIARPTRLTVSSPPTPHRVPRPIPITTRSNHPIPRTVHPPTNELKVYTSNPREDENSQLNLPPTTAALVIKKKVK